MAVQRYVERKIFPSIHLVASEEEVAKLLFEGVSGVTQVEFPIGDKAILPCGALIRRRGRNSYLIQGYSEETVHDTYHNAELTLDILSVLNKLDAEQIDTFALIYH